MAEALLIMVVPARLLSLAVVSLKIQAMALEVGVPVQRIGTVGGAALTLPDGGAISVAQLKAAHEAWLPGYMHQG